MLVWLQNISYLERFGNQLTSVPVLYNRKHPVPYLRKQGQASMKIYRSLEAQLIIYAFFPEDNLVIFCSTALKWQEYLLFTNLSWVLSGLEFISNILCCEKSYCSFIHFVGLKFYGQLAFEFIGSLLSLKRFLSRYCGLPHSQYFCFVLILVYFSLC